MNKKKKVSIPETNKKKWEVKKLGEVCEFRNGQAHEKCLAKNGKYKVINSKFVSSEGNEFKKTNNALSPLFVNDIVMVMSDVPNGKTLAKCFIIDENDTYTLNQRICVLRSNLFDTRFLYYQLNRNKYLLSFDNGENQTNLRKNDILNFPLFLPPLSEQKRIVAILDEAFSTIAKAKAIAEQNLKNAREIFESYLQEVFSNKGDGWVTKKLMSLIDMGWITSHLDGNHGGDYPRKEEFIKSGVPYISANCLVGTNVDFSKAKYLSETRASKIRKGIALNNDVLFAHNATVGPVSLLKTKEQKVILGTSLTYYRCNPKYILPEYLAHYMRSKEFKHQYELVMRQSTRNQVPITKQREFYHIIPPIDFQKKIITSLENLFSNSQKLEAIYQKKIDDLEELKKSILQRAFNGELKIV